MPASAVDELAHREQVRGVDEVEPRWPTTFCIVPLYWLTAFAFQK